MTGVEYKHVVTARPDTAFITPLNAGTAPRNHVDACPERLHVS